jgi:hypothetical protein
MPVILAIWEAEIRGITVQDQSGKISETRIAKITRVKMAWKSGSSGRALQAQSPEFKP